LHIDIPYGESSKSFDLPDSRLSWIISPKEVGGVPDEEAEILRAIRNPIGAPTLTELVAQKGREMVILVDDQTRATPQKRVLPLLLNELNRAGVADGEITILIALGTHRHMTEEECLLRLGAEVMGRVEVIDHAFDDPSQLVSLGETASGIPISVNRRYHESDISIAVGNIIPHIYAGWAGGGKMVQPGVCGPETTAATHMAAASMAPQILATLDNPIRREIDEVAQRSGLTMIVNTVLNSQKRIVKVVAGHVVEALRAGVKEAEPIYTVEIGDYPDIVIASSYPADLDLWQAGKALIHGALMTREVGTLILVTPCPEGVASQHPIVLQLGDASPAQIQRKMKQMEPADLIGAATHIAIGAVRERVKVIIVSDGLKEEEARRLGFRYAPDLQDALKAALTSHGAGAKVGVLTHGGDVAPRGTL
jgi:nickel-dependent lactate racemase